MNDPIITVSPEGDWFTVQYKGEVLACGHRPTVYDLQIILERLTGNPVGIMEVEE